ncbi:MAG: glycine/sarcosine/betaine reductase complex component C subunit alpha [Oscillospiraceae bacterium]
MANAIERVVANTFLELSEALTTGKMGSRPKIAVSGMSSEHGEDVIMAGAIEAQAGDVDVVYIGKKQSDKVRCVLADSEDDAAAKMEAMLDSGEVDGAVTMHYPFPIGVSTVGRVQAPANGRPMYLATTTGTSATDRVEGMIKNAIYGIIAAKACGMENPTVGIANLDGSRQVENELKKLAANGYPITFAESIRADGGCVLRGNDILTGAADIIVTDTLTGNILIKMLSAFTTGGSYESLGWGYGPGIGEGYDRLVLIISRASGAAVISGALAYAGQLVRGDWKAVAKNEFAMADKAGLKKQLEARKAAASAGAAAKEEVKAPPKEVVTGEIAGIDVMDIDDAVQALWKAGIYAEGGMGCTGPMVLVAEAKEEQAAEELKKAGYISG